MHSKKHLSFSAIKDMIADKFANVQDTRAPNASNSIKDTMLSGLACMYFQSDSLLEFQRTMERREQRNNVSVNFPALYDAAKSLAPRLYGRIARNSSLFLTL